MSFTYPLGLLGLIGVPILIILYIIKSHYTEQTVASVYLWQLSEKFLKKKKRVRFSGLISLILQILAVVAISLTIAGPVFTLADAANDYCFVLDASGSMTAASGETTRFEAGKEEIRKIINQSKDGSTYSLIYAGSNTYEVFTQVDDRDTALAFLDTLECDWGTNTCSDILSVLTGENAGYYTSDHSAVTYLVTDKAYETENIILVNMAQSEENYAFVSYEYRKIAQTVDGIYSQTVQVTGQVISYDRDATIGLELLVDGTVVDAGEVEVEKLVAGEFTLQTDITSFDCLTIRITNSDDLMADNEAVLYTTGQTQNNKTLIVSDQPTFLTFALEASGKTSVDVVSTANYNANPDGYTGYGLYIYDTGAEPEEVPKNASVWFFNVQKSVEGAGFSFREVVEATTVPEDHLSGNEEEDDSRKPYFIPEYTTSTSSVVREYTDGMIFEQLAVHQYSVYGTKRSSFTTLLYQQNGSSRDSLIFVGDNEVGNRQVVFAFDLHDSDLAMKADYLILLSNLLDYSFPEVVEQVLFTVGEELTVNVPAGCTDLLLEDPDGNITYPAFSSTVATCSLDQVGSYKVTVCFSDGEDQEYYVYARLPEQESAVAAEEKLSVQWYSDSTVSDGYYNKLTIYFIILALALVIDWGVYCYEQYQLR